MGQLLLICGIYCEYNNKCQDTWAMIQSKKHVTLFCHPKEQSNDDYKKMFEALIDAVETYQGKFD